MAARNSSRRFWFDPRFAIGLALIAVSVVGTVFVVGAADATTEVLVARSALVPGQKVTADDLSVTRVTLDDDTLYLDPAEVGDGALVVTRTVSQGELVPVSAVGSEQGERYTTVVVDLDGQLAESIAAGGTADLWATEKTEDGSYAAPSVIVGAATVVRLVEPGGIVVDEGAASVELLIPRDAAAKLLQAVANEASLALLPANLPTEG